MAALPCFSSSDMTIENFLVATLGAVDLVLAPSFEVDSLGSNSLTTQSATSSD